MTDEDFADIYKYKCKKLKSLEQCLTATRPIIK